MKINRQELLDCLEIAALAISARGGVEQSNCLVFKDGRILTYDGEVCITVPGLADVSGAIPSAGLVDLLKKIQDVEIEVHQEDGQLLIEGRNKKAAIRSEQSVIDLSEIPKPEKWLKLKDGILAHLRRAAETCGVDDTWGAATCVHVTSEFIEASDNFRLFRWVGKTGFKEEIFIPARSIYILSDFGPTAFATFGGWCHFRGAGDAVLSMRGKLLEAYPDMSTLCDVKGVEIDLPGTLAKVIARASITAAGKGHQTTISVDLRAGKGRIKSENEYGWYRESFAMKYTGPDLSFDAHPEILSEIVEFSKKVIVGDNRILATLDEALLVIALRVRED
jgi:hypothetical protein